MMAAIVTHYWRAWLGMLMAIALAYGLHLVYQLGQDSVRTQWSAERAEQAQQQATLVETYRLRERAAAKQAERIDREDFDKRNAALASAATARAAADGLRADIGALNASVPATATELAASLGQARAARDALGQCADRYSGVAAVADALAIQVTGLQDFVATAWPVGP